MKGDMLKTAALLPWQEAARHFYLATLGNILVLHHWFNPVFEALASSPPAPPPAPRALGFPPAFSPAA